MNLSIQQTKHIAELSKLDLSGEEVGKFQKQLSSILEYVNLLNEVDTTDVEPTAQTTGLKNVAKKDSPRLAGRQACGEPRLTQEDVLKNAPETKDGHIKTRSVFG